MVNKKDQRIDWEARVYDLVKDKSVYLGDLEDLIEELLANERLCATQDVLEALAMITKAAGYDQISLEFLSSIDPKFVLLYLKNKNINSNGK